MWCKSFGFVFIILIIIEISLHRNLQSKGIQNAVKDFLLI